MQILNTLITIDATIGAKLADLTVSINVESPKNRQVGGHGRLEEPQ